MAKNLIVVADGWTGEVKTSKVGEYISLAVTEKKLKPGGDKHTSADWEIVNKNYFNVSLEPGHNVRENYLYRVTGELKISKYNDEAGNEKVSFWIHKGQFSEITYTANNKNPVAENPDSVLKDFGAMPF